MKADNQAKTGRRPIDTERLFTRNVYVVDDEPNFRSAVYRTLYRAGFNVRAYSCGIDFLASYDGEAGAVIVDLAMPKLKGEDLVSLIVEKRFNLVVLVLTGHATIQKAIRLGQLGALNIIEKPVDNDFLVEKVSNALEISSGFFSRNILVDDYRNRTNSLTRREREILALVIAGMTSVEVAVHLGITRKTVDIHRGNLMRKMGSTSVAELATEYALYSSNPIKPL